MSVSVSFNNVYIQSCSSIGGPKEGKGPYGNYFDLIIDDHYNHQNTFEEGEVAMSSFSIKLALKKARLKKEDVPLMIGGDLSNQIAISSLVMKEFSSSSIGVYSACSTFSLSLGLASIFVENGISEYALSFTSSSFPVAERQFRYPNNYGIQKKETTTSTVTGAASFIVGKRKTKIRVSELTLGRVHDPDSYDLNDLGSPMAFAAFHTIKDHLVNFHSSIEDYDLIFTGDLSKIGSSVLYDCFKLENINLENHLDAGEIIYYREEEKMYAGGSGPSCIAIMSAGYVIKEMIKGTYKKVLLVATGALFSSTTSYQKKTIPVIAHAITLEVVK